VNHPAVEMTGITKTFGEKVIANDSVNFSVKKGEIHALVGENGAGKSTLMKILYGMHLPDSGTININGNEEVISSPAKAISLGIGMVHQHFMLVDTLTVLENIILGNEDTKFGGLLNLYPAENRIRKLIKNYNINIDIDEKIENLPVGLQQKVEILKILYRDAEILILDEPTAVLTPQEKDELFKSLRDLKEQGKTIILITHKLDEVKSISDSVTVLRRGKLAGVLETGKTSIDEIAKLMIGKDYFYKEEKPSGISGKLLLNVQNLSVKNDRGIETVRNVSFSIEGGEILGLAGIEGNGQTELIGALTSVRKIENGKFTFGGKSLDKIMIANIPANRQKEGIVKEFSIAENIILGRQKEKNFSNFLVLKQKQIKNYSAELISKFDIRPVDTEQKIKELSGGNQQKVVTARELSKNTGFIIASHPTRGLDIKASNFVHSRLLEAKKEGKAILLVSSDLNELLKLSDRIAVMYKGNIAAVLNAEKTNERELGLYMTGAKEKV
jgi:simple sugar transport system ATP-binding protein